MDIACKYNISFKSGLTAEIIAMEKSINPKQVERYFKNSSYKDWEAFYRIDLKGNKTHATANRLCADIFKNLRKIFDFRKGYSAQTLIFPQDLYVFNPKDSEYYNQCGSFFVNCAYTNPEKMKGVFDIGTFFMNNDISSLKFINGETESLYETKKVSSPHFMQPYVHEWFHAFFDKWVKNRAFLHSYSFDTTIQNYSQQTLLPAEKEIVADVISTYPTTVEHSQYAECFAEAWAKFVCEALAPDCKTFAKNPIDLLMKTPLEFQEILQKVTNIKMLHWG